MKRWPKTLRGSKRTPQKSCSPADGDNSSSRIVGAAIVAAGLTFSASLYPLPGQWPLLEIWEAEHGQSPGLPGLIESTSAKRIIELATVELPTLVHLTKILEDEFPAVQPDVLLKALEKYGLPEVTRSLEVLAASGLPTLVYPAPLAGGGGGGGGPSAAPPPIMLPQFAKLLEMLMQQLPGYLIEGLSDVIARMFPALLFPAQIQQMAQVLVVAAPPVVSVAPAAIDVPAPAPPVAAPTAVPPPPSDPVPVSPQPPAPPVEFVSVPTQEMTAEIGTVAADVTDSPPTAPDPVEAPHDSGIDDLDDNQDPGSGANTQDGAGEGASGTADGGTAGDEDEGSAVGTTPRESDNDPSSDPSGGDSSGDGSGGSE